MEKRRRGCMETEEGSPKGAGQGENDEAGG
jgi:hypothetical protein